MALKATICKAELQITDLDRNYYQSHSLTIAQHPSENDERLMYRIVAFALNASDSISFTKGISTDDEPDIWQKNLSDEIELWIDLGQPDEKRLRKACGRSQHVIVYTYKQRSADIWWQQMQDKVSRFNNLEIAHLKAANSGLLESMVGRNMSLQCTIQEGMIWLSDENQSTEIEVIRYSASAD